MNWAALFAGFAAGTVVGWPIGLLIAKVMSWRGRHRSQRPAAIQKAAALHLEVTRPALDEDALELLKNDPEEFLRRTRRRLP